MFIFLCFRGGNRATEDITRTYKSSSLFGICTPTGMCPCAALYQIMFYVNKKIWDPIKCQRMAIYVCLMLHYIIMFYVKMYIQSNAWEWFGLSTKVAMTIDVYFFTASKSCQWDKYNIYVMYLSHRLGYEVIASSRLFEHSAAP